MRKGWKTRFEERKYFEERKEEREQKAAFFHMMREQMRQQWQIEMAKRTKNEIN